MFVDIGSKRDGLVHVKDISKDYFINNHQSVSDLRTLFEKHFEFLPEYLNYTFVILKCRPTAREEIHETFHIFH